MTTEIRKSMKAAPSDLLHRSGLLTSASAQWASRHIPGERRVEALCKRVGRWTETRLRMFRRE